MSAPLAKAPTPEDILISMYLYMHIYMFTYVCINHQNHWPLKSYPYLTFASKERSAVNLTLVSTAILHWLSQKWVKCLRCLLFIHHLSEKCPPFYSFLQCSNRESENSVSQAPLPVGFLPIGGTRGNEQEARGERMLCLVFHSPFPLSSSDNDPGSSGVAVSPLLSYVMIPSSPPPFCAPRHKGESCFLKLLISGLLIFLISAFQPISCIESPGFEIPSVVLAFPADIAIFTKLLSTHSWVYFHQGSVKEHCIRLIWKWTEVYLLRLTSRLSCLLLGVKIRGISFLLALFKDYRKTVVQKHFAGYLSLPSHLQRGTHFFL